MVIFFSVTFNPVFSLVIFPSNYIFHKYIYRVVKIKNKLLKVLLRKYGSFSTMFTTISSVFIVILVVLVSVDFTRCLYVVPFNWWNHYETVFQIGMPWVCWMFRLLFTDFIIYILSKSLKTSWWIVGGNEDMGSGNIYKDIGRHTGDSWKKSTT